MFKTLLLTLSCICLPAVLFAQSTNKKSPQVWSVKIKGNKTFSDIKIKSHIATKGYSFTNKLKFWKRSAHKLNTIKIKKDAIRIQNFYNRHGFPNTSVSYRIKHKEKQWKKQIIFIVHEGKPIRVKEINIDLSGSKKARKTVLGNPVFQRLRQHNTLQVGKRFQPIDKAQITGHFTRVLKNMGFAYAKVSLDAQIDTIRLAAYVTVHANLGPIAYIHAISVKGNQTVNDQYVIRQSGLNKGERFSLKALQMAQRQVFDHPLFQFITINIPDQPKDSTLKLVMTVREKKLHTVKASIGVGTSYYLRGQVSWIDRSMFMRGHKFSATATASFIQQSLVVDYLFPYIFNVKSSFLISPSVEHLLEPGYELFSYGITNSFIYRYSQNLTASISYEFTRNDEHSLIRTEQLPDSIQSYNVSSLQFSGYYNQSLTSRRHKGWVIQPYFEISGAFGTATYSFEKLSLDIRRYTPLTKSTTLVMHIQGGRIFAPKTDSLPHSIRFYLGGTSSVRGWYRHELGPKRPIFENVPGTHIPDSTAFIKYVPVGGRTFFSFNLEIRQGIDKLINGFGIAAFIDGGQLWRRGVNFSKRSLQFAAGGGIRYSSPIGDIRLYVGCKLNPTNEDLGIYRGHDYGNFWDHIAIHLSIGRAF